MRPLFTLTLALFIAATAGCDARTAASGEPHGEAQGEGDGDGHDKGAAGRPPAGADRAPADPNRIDLPDAARQNLGITFAKAQRRRVASTLRAPGRFEPLPAARREYSAVLPGRVELLVRQYQPVEPGAPLYRVESPEWLKLRQQLQEEQSAISRTEAELAVARATRAEAAEAVRLQERRVATLGEAGVRRAELEADLAARRSSLPRLEAEVRAREADHRAARQRFPLTIASAASLLATDAKALGEPVGEGADAQPRWSTIDAVEVRAAQAGVVESLAVTNGAWVEASKPVLATVDPTSLRFRAVGLQADLGKLRNGLRAEIVPPRNGTPAAEPIPGTLMLGLSGDPESRTIELVVMPEKLGDWPRAGVTAFLEVAVDDSEVPEPAIPVAAVIQDELTKVFFLRDPKDPGRVIRTEADLGASDGHWVVVNSGIKAGDEVVVEGVYELKLASAGRGGGGAAAGAPKGHFHADGSYHEGKDGGKK